MKKSRTLLSVVLVVTLGAMSIAGNPIRTSQREKIPDHIEWGISQEEVRKGEEGPPDPRLSGKDILVFRSKLFGEDVLLQYAFAQDRLTGLNCVFTKYLEPPRYEQKGSAGQFIYDYLKLVKRLTKKYGKPRERGTAASSEELNSLDLSLDNKDPKKLALTEQAIRRGAACWYSTWRTGDTSLVLLLRGARGAINLEMEIEYTGPNSNKTGAEESPAQGD